MIRIIVLLVLAVSSFGFFHPNHNNATNTWYKRSHTLPDSVKQKLDKMVKQLATRDSCRMIAKIEFNKDVYYAGYDGRTNSIITDFSVPVEIGSCSKLYTAAAIHQLIEQKKFSLSSKLVDVLPNPTLYKHLLVIDSVDYIDSVTVLNLLNHTSGFPDYFMKDLHYELAAHGDSTLQFTPTQLITLAKRLKNPTFKTNEKWGYSNVNYVLLGMIIERVTGMPYQQYIQEHMLKPLGLHHTYFGSVNPPALRAAGFYNKKPVQMPATFAWSAGEMVVTLDDMTKFIDAWYLGKIFRNQSTTHAIQFDNMKDMGMGINYGMGSIRLKGKSWGHSGETFGSSSYMAALPNGSRFALSIDDANVGNWLVAMDITEWLYALK